MFKAFQLEKSKIIFSKLFGLLVWHTQVALVALVALVTLSNFDLTNLPPFIIMWIDIVKYVT